MLTFYKKKRFSLRKLVLLVNMCIMIGCMAYLGNYYKESRKVVAKVDEIKELIVEEEEEVIVDEKNEPITKPMVDKKTGELILLNKFKKALKKYPDLVGWIKIDDLIDYPVMQTGIDDPLYYLYKNIDGEYSKAGTIYMDARSDIKKPSTNFILYGHNMMNMSMFGWLSYYANEDFYKEHPIINFDTLYFTGKYEIVAAFYSEYFGEDEEYADEFKYYEFINAKNKKEYNAYIKQIKSMALYDTGVKTTYGDQLLTLSTCNHMWGKQDGRFVVVARLKRSMANADKGNKMDLEDDEYHQISVTPSPDDEEEDEDEDATKKPKKSKKPTKKATKKPTKKATKKPTNEPTKKPTKKAEETKKPDTTKAPLPTTTKPANKTKNPTKEPTSKPTKKPTKEPIVEPTDEPVVGPTDEPIVEPTIEPTEEPIEEPTEDVTQEPDNSDEQSMEDE